jgi:hypothetical protein
VLVHVHRHIYDFPCRIRRQPPLKQEKDSRLRQPQEFITATSCRIRYKIKLLIRQGLDASPAYPVASDDTGAPAALFPALISSPIKMPDSTRKPKKAPANCYAKNVGRVKLLPLNAPGKSSARQIRLGSAHRVLMKTLILNRPMPKICGFVGPA